MLSRILFFLAVFCVSPTVLSALPRFALQQGAKCSLCHINPTGGGIRNDYGADIFARTMLSMPPKKVPQQSSDFGRIGDSARLGGDLRMAYLYASDDGLPSDPQDLDSLFLMQSDLYLAAKLSEKLVFSSDIGLRGTFEVLALLHDLPGGSYLKAGAFVPPYGLKFPEHTNVNRLDLNFDPGVVDTGIELGRVGKHLGAHLMLSTGDLSRGAALANGVLFQGHHAVSASVDYTLQLSPLSLLLGLSGAFDPEQGQLRTRLVSQNTLRTTAGRTLLATDVKNFKEQKYGFFAGASLGKLWYLAEFDWVQNIAEPNKNGEAFLQELAGDKLLPAKGYLSYQEIGISITQGLDASLLVEYHDPDAAVKKSEEVPLPTDPVLRTGFSLEYFPTNQVEISLLYRHNSAALAGLVEGVNDGVLMLHLFY